MNLTLTSLGGAGTVTGSRHLLEAGGRRILLDCGLFQGLKNLRLRNWDAFPVDPATIDAVVLSHGHLDHCGYLPKLVREGFRGQIVCTPATEAVAEIILKDSGRLQEKDAESANRHSYSRHQPALPLYTEHEAIRALKRFSPLAFDQERELSGGARLRLRRAGHILGAATVELRWQGRTVVFSGDLGRYGDPLMPDPEPVSHADILLVESTYGDREHEPVDAETTLGDIIERTVRRGGTVVIPAFAVGRAQLLLYHLWKLKSQGRLPLIPVYLDSPMAIAASRLLEQFPDDLRLDREASRRVCAVAEYVEDVEHSKAVMMSPHPKVIIAASGMATGGRVLHHLKASGRDHRNTILFSGYQAAGTRGAALVGGAREVKIHGSWLEIRAEVAQLPMLSAHADCGEIITWLRGFKAPPRQTFVVHGEPSASEAMRVKIGRELRWDCTVAEAEKPYSI